MSEKEEKLILILKDTLHSKQAPHILDHCVIQGEDVCLDDKYHLNKIGDKWCVYEMVNGEKAEEVSFKNCFSACILYIGNVVMDAGLCYTLQNQFIEHATPIVRPDF